ncbi:MAG: hypothetical protein ACOCV1_04005, partial [Bacillota bacterium]
IFGTIWKTIKCEKYFSKKIDFCHFYELGERCWSLSGIDKEIKDWAKIKSNRKGDWNESGYYEKSNPHARFK